MAKSQRLQPSVSFDAPDDSEEVRFTEDAIWQASVVALGKQSIVAGLYESMNDQFVFGIVGQRDYLTATKFRWGDIADDECVARPD